MLQNNKTYLFILLFVTICSLLLWIAPWQKRSHIELAIQQEETELPLHVEGQFPTWLSGSLVRNSSIPIYEDGKQISHPFDGLAMLHGFDFKEGKVRYTNRFLLSQEFYQVVREGSTHYSGFASTSKPTLWERIENFLFIPDKGVQNALVNVYKYGNHYVALTEVPLPARFDLKSLQTLGPFDYEDHLPKSHSWESAHPHLDFHSKDILNYLIEFGPQSHYILYRIPDGSSSREVISKIPVDLPSYMHSFAVTEHYLILTEFPLIINPQSLMQGKSFMHSMHWQLDQQTRFLVVDRSSGQIKAQALTDPFFSFHHANAYEDGDDIIIDLVAYPNPFQAGGFLDPKSEPSILAPSQWKRRLMRYTFSLPKQQISSEVVLEKEVEFPRLDDRLDGKKYRYLYLTLDTDNKGGLVKVDQEQYEVKTWLQVGNRATEPIFVPAPDAKKEDEGVILSVVFNEEKNQSFLVALDAHTFSEIARASLPFHIPDSFHGQYFAESTFIKTSEETKKIDHTEHLKEQ
jgi:carotenoid cleavage dioxygenase-like enzyme